MHSVPRADCTDLDADLAPQVRTAAGAELRLCDGAEHSGLGKALTGLLHPGGAGGLKACRHGTRDVHRVVVEEQHPLGWHLQQVCDLREGCGIGLKRAQLEGQEPVVKQASQRPCGDVAVPVQRIGVTEAARGNACPGLGDELCRPGQRPRWPVLEGFEKRSWTEFELPVRNHPSSELSRRAATALKATYPAARQPAPPQVLFALDAGELQHGAHAGYLDEYTTEIEQHQINALSHASNLRAA